MEAKGKQDRFVEEFCIDNNGKQAAIRAGYSPKTAEQQASRLLRNVKVLQSIVEKQKVISESTQVDAEYVRMRHKAIDEMDVLDIFVDDLSGFKPLSEWPKVWRTTISALDIAEIFEYEDGKKELSGLLKKIKWPDKVKNLELLGKHTDVRAYSENINANINAKHNIMPVPVADSAESWEEAAQRQQSETIGK